MPFTHTLADVLAQRVHFRARELFLRRREEDVFLPTDMCAQRLSEFEQTSAAVVKIGVVSHVCDESLDREVVSLCSPHEFVLHGHMTD